MDAAEQRDYRRAARLSGGYRDIQGAEARAWFGKSPDGAECRTPAESRQMLFFCAAVFRDGAVLRKAPARLCL